MDIESLQEALVTSRVRYTYLMDIVKDAHEIQDPVSENIYTELATLHQLFQVAGQAIAELQNKEMQHHGRLGGGPG